MGLIQWPAMIVVLCYILVIVLLVKLQIKLSRKSEWWKGLIIPLIFFLLAIMMVMGSFTYGKSTTKSTIIDSYGNVVSEIVEEQEDGNSQDGLFSSLYLFVLGNIPTILFVGIYFSQRGNITKHKELNKMNIQDL